MALHFKVLLFCLCLGFWSNAQKLNSDFGLTLDVKVALGNQNKMLQVGMSTFGAVNYAKVAIEGGFSLYKGFILQRHTIVNHGFIGGYDAFYLAGYGNNHNLLGSSLSQYKSPLLFYEDVENSFIGLGFGFEKQYLPYELQEFNQRLGRILIRYSKNQDSYGLTFKNDLRIGSLFYGDATDFGDTGTLQLSYTNILTPKDIQRFGFTLQLFTPKPDYNRIANHERNSDEGRKNVWHTLGTFKDVFYANAYVDYTYQSQNKAYQSKLGIESNKLGAYIQNKLHDNFGLNPRYPWHVTQANKLFVEGQFQYFMKNN